MVNIYIWLLYGEGWLAMGPSMGVSIVMGAPKNGWFLVGKIPSRNGWWLGVPPFMETPNWIYFLAKRKIDTWCWKDWTHIPILNWKWSAHAFTRQARRQPLETAAATPNIWPPLVNLPNLSWLVVGGHPSEKIWVRQLGWFETQYYMGKCQKWQPNHQPVSISLVALVNIGIGQGLEFRFHSSHVDMKMTLW